MIVDTSALVAIFREEPGYETFLARLRQARIRRLSAANHVELFVVLIGRFGSDAARRAETFLDEAAIVIEPLTAEHAFLAREAFLRFGKGRHPAGLNFGDCFAYALARAMGEPLLFKGDDFALTDIAPAL